MDTDSNYLAENILTNDHCFHHAPMNAVTLERF